MGMEHNNIEDKKEFRTESVIDEIHEKLLLLQNSADLTKEEISQIIKMGVDLEYLSDNISVRKQNS